jgi:hypothetical protein
MNPLSEKEFDDWVWLFTQGKYSPNPKRYNGVLNRLRAEYERLKELENKRNGWKE